MEWKSDKTFGVLHEGLKGGKVKALQKWLNERGASLVVDGYFGRKTFQAVADYQKKYGILLNRGIVDATMFLAPYMEKPKIKDIENIVDDLPRNNPLRRNPEDVIGVIVHHSSTISTLGGSNPYAYAHYHVENRGWNCIAYNYVIQPNEGKIYKCLNLTDKGYHVGRLNSKYYAVCLSGDYDIENVSNEMYELVAEAIHRLVIEASLYLGHEWVPKIEPHRKFAQKTCPGNKFNMILLKQLCGRRFKYVD
jgi:N-acetyl-anhydromuramyl-L-alanine amidase AmpD